jgi:hypothetical protein
MGQTVDQCVRSEASLQFMAAADKAPFALCDNSQVKWVNTAGVYSGGYPANANGVGVDNTKRNLDQAKLACAANPNCKAVTCASGGTSSCTLRASEDYKASPSNEDSYKMEVSSVPELIGAGGLLVKNTKVGEVQASKNYEVSFVLTPHHTLSGWTNIFHFTQTGNNCCNQGDRIPAVWFFSDTTRLHVRSSQQSNGNGGCDTNDQLPIGQATKVDIRVENDKLQVFFGGNLACETNPFSSPTDFSVPQTLQVWASDPWYTASGATLSHLTYKSL